MSRLDQLRQWWREHPDNDRNWDLERFKRERLNIARLFVLYGAVFVIMLIFQSSVLPIPLHLKALMFILFLCYLPYDFLLTRKMRKLEEDSN